MQPMSSNHIEHQLTEIFNTFIAFNNLYIILGHVENIYFHKINDVNDECVSLKTFEFCFIIRSITKPLSLFYPTYKTDNKINTRDVDILKSAKKLTN